MNLQGKLITFLVENFSYISMLFFLKLTNQSQRFSALIAAMCGLAHGRRLDVDRRSRYGPLETFWLL